MDMILAFALSLVVTALSGLVIIPWLRRLKLGQKILDIGPSWHKSKQGTPFMGGIMFILGITIATAIFGYHAYTTGDFRPLLVLFPAYAFGVIGAVDDYAKRIKKQNKGLTVLQKLVLQVAVAVIFLTLLQWNGLLNTTLTIPFFGVSFSLDFFVYIVLAAVYIVGFDNAVNLTDGVDGLASGVTLPIAVFFAVTAALTGAGTNASAAVPAAALAGGLIGFLIYNYHPAKVFMGDTGSLFLGGMVCGLAFVCDMPLILIPVGIIYLAEVASDLLQVGYFKLSGGKRIFKMAPLHHHFEMKGWSEEKLFVIFTFITALACVLSYLDVAGIL